MEELEAADRRGLVTRSKHRSCSDSGFVSPPGTLVPRFGLHRRVPHGRSVSCHHKLAQWVEQRLGNRVSRVRLPHLYQSATLGLDGVDARLTPRIEVSF